MAVFVRVAVPHVSDIRHKGQSEGAGLRVPVNRWFLRMRFVFSRLILIS